jgi:hypothetical protein
VPKLVANYVESYRGSGESVTQSALDVEGVAKAASALADVCIPLLDDPAGFAHVSRAAKNAQRPRRMTSLTSATSARA